MRLRRTIGLGVVSAVLAGCYTLEPARGVTPDLGAQVALDLNDAGRAALGGALGPEVSQIEGRLVQRDDNGYLLAVSLIHLLRGGEQTWSGEHVAIKPEYVATVYRRQFSAGRTVAAGAIGLGAIGAILAARGIIGSGTMDIPSSPGDTAATIRRPRPR